MSFTWNRNTFVRVGKPGSVKNLKQDEKYNSCSFNVIA